MFAKVSIKISRNLALFVKLIQLAQFDKPVMYVNT